MLLKGKRALITGSTSGIGAQCARVLAGEGVSVVINGMSTAERFQASGAEQKQATGVRVADMKRGPIGPLFMSAAKIMRDYVGMISPVSGSTSAAALAWFCSALEFDRRRFVDCARR
jgi:3-oxoacyl-[acyl-carrier protein] reductase